MNKQGYIVSVDWLSIFCESGILQHNSFYKIVKQQKHSNIFKDLYFVYDVRMGEKYAEIQKNPFSHVIAKTATMIKIENRMLYRKDLWDTLGHFLNTLGVWNTKISRMDTCIDFQVFANGVTPQNLINGLLNGTYIKMGQTKYNLIGDLNKKHEYDYIRFGNRDSQVSVYLYNKTKELREQKDKPYIRERWEAAGLDTTKDVYRLEFSMRTTQLRVVEKQTGEQLRLGLDYFTSQGIVENLTKRLVEQYFDIRKNDDQKQRRRMRKLCLFEGAPSTVLFHCPTNKANTNRIDKIVVTRLARAYEHYRVDDEYHQKEIDKALKIILDQTDLWEYFYHKVEPMRGHGKE